MASNEVSPTAGRTSVAFWPGMMLTIDHPSTVTVTGGMEPDPEWRHLDERGHGHWWHGERGPWASGNTAETLPTLHFEATRCTMGHGADCRSEGNWCCNQCGAVVEPRFRPQRDRIVPGPTRYTLTVQEAHGEARYVFGDAEYRDLGAAFRSAIEATLAARCTERTIRG